MEPYQEGGGGGRGRGRRRRELDVVSYRRKRKRYGHEQLIWQFVQQPNGCLVLPSPVISSGSARRRQGMEAGVLSLSECQLEAMGLESSKHLFSHSLNEPTQTVSLVVRAHLQCCLFFLRNMNGVRHSAIYSLYIHQQSHAYILALFGKVPVALLKLQL